jgi:hypothetical protein
VTTGTGFEPRTRVIRLGLLIQYDFANCSHVNIDSGDERGDDFWRRSYGMYELIVISQTQGTINL